MIFCSYGTKNTPYEGVIKDYLIKSLDKLNLDYHVEYPEDFGSWSANTHYKAEFVKKCLLELKESVVFVDSDATVLRDPVLFDEIEKGDNDIALHYLDWFKNWRNQDDGDRFEALSGTMYFRYNQKVLDFLDIWIKKNKENAQWEQRNMQEILEENVVNLDIEKLPYSYCVVVNHSNKIPKHMINPGEVVILHWQKSRLYKNKRLWKTT